MLQPTQAGLEQYENVIIKERSQRGFYASLTGLNPQQLKVLQRLTQQTYNIRDICFVITITTINTLQPSLIWENIKKYTNIISVWYRCTALLLLQIANS